MAISSDNWVTISLVLNGWDIPPTIDPGSRRPCSALPMETWICPTDRIPTPPFLRGVRHSVQASWGFSVLADMPCSESRQQLTLPTVAHLSRVPGLATRALAGSGLKACFISASTLMSRSSPNTAPTAPGSGPVMEISLLEPAILLTTTPRECYQPEQSIPHGTGPS